MSSTDRFPRLIVPSTICLLSLMLSYGNAQPRTVSGQRPGESDGPKVPGFGHVEGTPPIPGFGVELDTGMTLLAEDFSRSDERMREVDTNRDGYIDRDEARRARWSDDPFQYDYDRDNRLNRTELAHRYAARRIRDSAARTSAQAPSSSSSRQPGSSSNEQRREQERPQQETTRQYGGVQATRESWGLADTLMRRHDRNRDGYLDASERRSMGMHSLAADTNRDYRISRHELAVWLADQQLERSRILPPDLPAWFVELDRDGDGQVSLAEFADELTDEKWAEFSAYDTNNDGFLEPSEVLRAMERSRHQYSNDRLALIPPQGVTRSEIEIDETARIAQVEVVLSITHLHTGHLKAYLIGPAGQRVELFANVGGSDDHFEDTVLDDEAPTSITRGRPPFAGRFHTSDRTRNRPGLRQFRGQEMQGRWTLLIEANSDRPGALHSWALVIRKIEEQPPPPSEDDYK
jgi:subtilisin-like proprotein convertase family protein